MGPIGVRSEDWRACDFQKPAGRKEAPSARENCERKSRLLRPISRRRPAWLREVAPAKSRVGRNYHPCRMGSRLEGIGGGVRVTEKKKLAGGSRELASESPA